MSLVKFYSWWAGLMTGLAFGIIAGYFDPPFKNLRELMPVFGILVVGLFATTLVWNNIWPIRTKP